MFLKWKKRQLQTKCQAFFLNHSKYESTVKNTAIRINYESYSHHLYIARGTFTVDYKQWIREGNWLNHWLNCKVLINFDVFHRSDQKYFYGIGRIELFICAFWFHLSFDFNNWLNKTEIINFYLKVESKLQTCWQVWIMGCIFPVHLIYSQ